MTAISQGYGGKLDLARVIGRTAELLKEHPLIMLGLPLVIVGAPTAVQSFLFPQTVAPGAVFTAPYWARIAVQLLVGAFVQGCLLYAAWRALTDKVRPGVADVLRAGLRFALPLLLLTVLGYLAFMLGMALLIVPGVLIGLAWIVAAPALVAEGRPPLAVFGRSAQLTRGNRWRILGLVMLIFIALLGVEAAVGVFRVVGGVLAAPYSPLQIVLIALIGAAMVAITSAGSMALYAELRGLKEGVGPSGVGEVFD